MIVSLSPELDGQGSGDLLGALGLALDDAHDIAFLHDNKLFAVELDLGAGPFAEQHPVAGLDVERVDLAILAARAGPTATTSPSCGFSLAVSGMMIPPAVFSS